MNRFVILATAAGLDKLDQGGWAIVSVIQRIGFWISIIISIKDTIMYARKRQGEISDLLRGYVICAGIYLSPFLMGIIRDIFAR